MKVSLFIIWVEDWLHMELDSLDGWFCQCWNACMP